MRYLSKKLLFVIAATFYTLNPTTTGFGLMWEQDKGETLHATIPSDRLVSDPNKNSARFASPGANNYPFQVSFPDASMTLGARVATISVVQKDVGGEVGSIIEFWRSGYDEEELEKILDTIAPGLSVFVTDRFRRPRNPWRLGEIQTECFPNQDCLPDNYEHYWLIKPLEGSSIGPVLVVGYGGLDVNTLYPIGRPPEDIYRPTTSIREATISAKLNDNDTYLVARLKKEVWSTPAELEKFIFELVKRLKRPE
ncbi:hypothetical protein [Roseibium sediminicola]|uniref:Uncharacterized protein n=1 Tax=Roseibium sediminicola TaxID=2933272 RepID=A0ABT0H3J0_9HYPH|nr:hypothetical protein [Roseibium sp. CAU 1639]MCK7616265.1 hypothetical protein [Roseibium sp. CAU 1639]